MASPTTLVQALVRTLGDEQVALVALDTHLCAQLAALRTDDLPALQEASMEASEAAHALGQVRERRERQQRLVARTLGSDEDAAIEELAAVTDNHDNAVAAELREARAELVARATDAQANSEALTFALDHAASVGRALLGAWQHLQQPATGVYTAVGKQAAPAAMPSRLDRAG